MPVLFLKEAWFRKWGALWLLASVLVFAPALCLSANGPGLGALPVQVGVLLDLSGPLSIQGEAAYKSIQYAVEEINILGGVSGRRIAITVFDTKSDGTRMLEGASQLKAQGAAALIGPTSPANCLLLRRYAEQQKIPLILISGTTPILTFSGIKTKWTFSTTLNFSSELKALFGVFKNRNYKTLAVLVQTGNFYRELFLWIRGYAPEYGLRLDCAERFDLNPEDLSQKVSFINKCSPDAALIWANGNANSLFSDMIERIDLPLGISHHLFGPIENQGSSNVTSGLLFVALPSALAPSNLRGKLSFSARDFLKRWGQELLSMPFETRLYAAQAWDALNILVKALRFSRGSRASVRKALETNIKDYYGAVGKFSYDKRDHSYLEPQSLTVLRFFAGRWRTAR